jgi:predicted PurR-regulated permease PerM
MRLPSDPNGVLLGGLFILAALASTYWASEIVLPFVRAFILKLLLQPAVLALEQVYLTRTLASLLLIVVICGTIVGLTVALSMPASNWAAKLPQGVSRLEERLSFLRGPTIETLRQRCGWLRCRDWSSLPPSKAPRYSVNCHLRKQVPTHAQWGQPRGLNRRRTET